MFKKLIGVINNKIFVLQLAGMSNSCQAFTHSHGSKCSQSHVFLYRITQDSIPVADVNLYF